MLKYILQIKTLWLLFKPFHKYIYFQIILVFIFQVLSIATTVLNSKLINNLVANKLDIASLFFATWAVVIIIMNAVYYLQNSLREKHLDESVKQYLQEYSLRKILSLTIEQHIEDHSSIKQQIIAKGEASAGNIIGTIFTNIIPTVLYTLVAIVTLTWYYPLLGVVTLSVITVLTIWAYYFRSFHNPYVKKNRDNWIQQNKTRTEAFTHLPLAKYFSRENFFIKKYIDTRAKIVVHHQVTRILSAKHVFKRSNFQDLAELFSLGIAASLFVQGNFQIGTLYLVLSVTSRVYSNLNSFSSALRDLPVWFLDVEKYLEAIERVPNFEENGEQVPLDVSIKVDNLSFSYPKSHSSVLNKISFTIEKNKVTAFVGASGSGKSTITKLLLRAYTYSEGSILVGDTELRNIDASYMRKHIGYVEQHVDLLDESIRDNIFFGLDQDIKKTSEDELEAIAHKARIDQFYHRLSEKKFDTLVGERGVKLSGGERQRVGIARAIIKNPEILIFDEATSSLDSENEKYVMDAINDVSRGKTTIIIAHRLSTIRNADKIIVMDKGNVVGEGTHDELMQKSSHYKTLVEHQVLV